MRFKSLAKALTVGAFLLVPTVVSAHNPRSLNEDFNRRIPLKATNSSASLWTINYGDGENWRVEDYCGADTCITYERQGGTKFVRLAQYTNHVADTYYNAELAEYRTFYAYGQEGKWLPSVHKPVEVEARIRFSSNYNTDGSGGAIGSAGIWLWNSPLDINSYDYIPQTGIGFNWLPTDSLINPGLNVTAYRDSYPEYANPVSNVNLSQWNKFKMKWSVNNSGVQKIEYYFNHSKVGEYVLPAPLDALSLEIWNDNQMPALVNGEFGLAYSNPTSNQYFDLDYVKVSK